MTVATVPASSPGAARSTPSQTPLRRALRSFFEQRTARVGLLIFGILLVAAIGADAAAGSTAEFGAFLKNEMAKWAKVVKDSGVKLE